MPKSVTMNFPGKVSISSKGAPAKEIKKELKRLSNILGKAAKSLSGVDYETMPDKFEDTEVETWTADIAALRQVLYRLAESVNV